MCGSNHCTNAFKFCKSKLNIINSLIRDIDSMWSSGINNFEFDHTKFPDPKGFIDYVHSKGCRVILWATSVVNQDSSNFQEGLSNNYYLNNGTILHWWRGKGAWLD